MAEILVFKTDSFDTDALVEDVLAYSADSIVLVLGFDGRIKVVHMPGGEGKQVVGLFRFKGERLNNLFSPLIFLFDLAVYARLFTAICIRHRPRLCWIENTFAAAIAGALRKFGLCGSIVYLPGDWLMPEKRGAGIKKSLWGMLFIAADYAACRSASLVLNSTHRITEARLRFWGRAIARKEELYHFNMKVKALEVKKGARRKICFLGNVREDSGLEIIMGALKKIREKQDVALKFIGPSGGYERIRRMAGDFRIEEHVELLGFVERDRLPQAVSDCFCGVNLLTSPDSYSSYTIPGKLVHYLQFLLPVITTPGAGVMAGVISDNRLGLVIEPRGEEFVGAALKLHLMQDEFRENISGYIAGLPRVEFQELIEA